MGPTSVWVAVHLPRVVLDGPFVTPFFSCRSEEEDLHVGRSIQGDRLCREVRGRGGEVLKILESGAVVTYSGSQSSADVIQRQSRFTLFRSPSKFIEEPDYAIEPSANLPSIHVFFCALCRLGSSNMDIVVAPCLCTYHPWCVVMQTWSHERCANVSCTKIFPDP